MADEDRSEEDIGRQLVDAVEGVIRGSMYAPPDLESAMLVDCVVVMGWTDHEGMYQSTHFRHCSPWAAEGLVETALRSMRRPSVVVIQEDDDDG